MYKYTYSRFFCLFVFCFGFFSGHRLKAKEAGCPSTVEWLNKLGDMNVMEYYCAIRNDERDGFRDIWEELHELMHSEMSRQGEQFKLCQHCKNEQF